MTDTGQAAIRHIPVRDIVLVVVLLAAILACAFLSLCVGSRMVPPAEAWRALVDYTPTDDAIVVRDVRVPRAVLAIVVGAALAIAGALIQTMTRNPLAEPGILGVTAGAGFALTLGVAVWGVSGQVPQMVVALVGALAAMVAVYTVGRVSPLYLLLAGVALTAVLGGINLGLRLLDADLFDRYRFWVVGSLAGREQVNLTLPVIAIVVALVASMLIIRPLTSLTLGEDVARALGTRVGATRTGVIILVTALAGVATAIAGPIAFAGLIVPHLARGLARGSVGRMMLYTLLMGPILMIAADIVSRVLLPTGEVPVATVMAFIGAPMLIWVVRRYGVASL